MEIISVWKTEINIIIKKEIIIIYCINFDLGAIRSMEMLQKVGGLQVPVQITNNRVKKKSI